MQHRDPKGYYHTLGVPPVADAAAIKAAYRRLARQLHPDLNAAPDATERFRAVRQAYEVLGDPDARGAYDDDASRAAGTLMVGSNAPRAAEAAETAPEPPAAPVACCRCSVVPLQPRFRSYTAVISHVFGARRRVTEGAFCAACETWTAAWATARTIVLGWWSVQGAGWSLQALARNLTAFRSFRTADARLMADQAAWFASTGEVATARAVAQEAVALSRVGEPHTAEERARVREDALRLLSRTSRCNDPMPRLPRRSSPYDARMLAQAVVVLALPAVVAVQLVADHRAAAERREVLARQRAAELLAREQVERAQADDLARQQINRLLQKARAPAMDTVERAETALR